MELETCPFGELRHGAAACTDVMRPPMEMVRSDGCSSPALAAATACSYELPSGARMSPYTMEVMVMMAQYSAATYLQRTDSPGQCELRKRRRGV